MTGSRTWLRPVLLCNRSGGGAVSSTGPDESLCPRICGPTEAGAALRRLSSDDRPFLLLVECEEPDSASHDRDLPRVLSGLRVIEATLEVLLDFASDDQETLLVFTSDHETGGLALSIANGHNRELEAIWATSDHTGVVVPLLAFGPGSEAFGGIRANWEVGRLLRTMLWADRRPTLSEGD